MGERINRTDEVGGSSPPSSTDWQIADGRWLTPAASGGDAISHVLSATSQNGAVAKLGSRLNGIEKAEGSSPSGSTLFGREAACVHRAGGFLLSPKSEEGQD